MADPAPQTDAPATAPPPSFDDLLGDDKAKKLTSDLTSIYEQKGKTEAALSGGEQRQLQQDRSRMERAFQQEGHVVDDLKPWNADQEMAKRSHSPMEEFGSFATIFSIAASAFTHTPATNAMNAAAAYMNAVNEGDEKSYNKAFTAFKENADLAIKRADIEHRQFEDANKLLTTDQALWRAKTEAAAARFGNQKILALLRAGLDPEVLNAQESYFKAKEGMVTAFEKISDAKLKLDYVTSKMNELPEKERTPEAYMKFVREYERQQAEAKYAGHLRTGTDARLWDAAEQLFPNDKQAQADWVAAEKAKAKPTTAGSVKAQDRESVKADVKKEHPEMTEGQVSLETDKRIKEANAAPVTGNVKLRQEQHIAQYDESITAIDGIVSVLEKHAGSAGLAGRATRLKERVSDILGSSETDRVQMMRDIERLQTMAPRLILDQAVGRPLAADEHRINDIVAGLNVGDTTANTLRSMNELKTLFKRMRDKNAGLIGKGGSAEAPVTAKPPVADWDEFPKVQ